MPSTFNASPCATQGSEVLSEIVKRAREEGVYTRINTNRAAARRAEAPAFCHSKPPSQQQRIMSIAESSRSRHHTLSIYIHPSHPSPLALAYSSRTDPARTAKAMARPGIVEMILDAAPTPDDSKLPAPTSDTMPFMYVPPHVALIALQRLFWSPSMAL